MKYAYLIMAHNNFKILELLLLALDNKNNDLFLHIDKKVKNKKELSHRFRGLIKQSKLYILDKSINVKWGKQSQTMAELLLYEEALRHDRYHYYHLLSGVDLPLKPQSAIISFFEDKNFAFLSFSDDLNIWDYQRLSRYHFFSKRYSFISWLTSFLNRMQEHCKIDRFKKYSLVFQRGHNWCSLPHDVVVYLVSKKKLIKRMCRFTICSDECYKQIILYNSPYRNRIYYNENGKTDDLRFVDWSQGGKHPHIFKMDDYTALYTSPELFGRKFDETVDLRVANAVFKTIMQ